jgi:predicted lipid-binding transport protein (Tim44 family)
LSEKKFREILKYFCFDETTNKTSIYTKISRNTINKIYDKIRQINFIIDENNKVIDGAESKIINLIDNWAFAKNTKLNNSAWQLIATN